MTVAASGMEGALGMAGQVLDHLCSFWINQIGGTFLAPGSTLALWGLVCTLLWSAFLAVPRGRRRMPRLKLWRRALLPRRLWRSDSGRADIGWFLYGMLGHGLLFGWAFVSSTAVASMLAPALSAMFGKAAPLTLPPGAAAVLLTVVFFVAYDFAYWLDHFLSHKIPWLWRVHQVHHAAESLSLLTNFRVHPLDTIVFGAIVALVLGLAQAVAARLLGPAAQPFTIGGTNALVMLSAVLLTHLQHSHLWISFGPRWGRWLLGAAHHQIHHSADERHFDRNFGNVLAIWDRLFGTFYLPASRREVRHFGLGSRLPSPHGWRAALLPPNPGRFTVAVADCAPR